MLECVILIGLPGAGKTTFYRRHFASHTHISKDLWPNASGRDARQRRFLDEALAAGQSVVVDNTHPTIGDRAAIIAAARARGAQVVGYFVDVTSRVAVARNAGRSGREKVPNVAIFTVAKRLQPPTLAEGFDQLFRVEVAEDCTFRVLEVRGTG
jgi:predicted kinase